MMVNNQSYKYRLWDHLGIQRKPPISNTNIKNAHIVLIIFAINNKKSFEEVDYWYNYIKDPMRRRIKLISFGYFT